MTNKHLSHSEMLQLKRVNTPTIYNGWEQITKRDAAKECFNLEETHDFMPEKGPMIGRAVTVQIKPSDREYLDNNRSAMGDYYEYVSKIEGPKIMVVQDLDKPKTYGSFWGEVNANVHRQMGCVGAIIDGAIRDVDEMKNAGFKALAQRLCIGHACAYPMNWGEPVEVFGCEVKTGQLIHADKHGFIVIPEEDESQILEASMLMDQYECETVIQTARSNNCTDYIRFIEQIRAAGKEFNSKAQEKFNHGGEW
ncbi:MAG: dimethylmenaquinone methyltransferase [Planctomycetota bacterium]|nr:MAG: dimethylmenaquinone methyltransferase [Planctomycetota bacterium]